MSKFCTECGVASRGGAFCASCGNSLESEGVVGEVANQVDSTIENLTQPDVAEGEWIVGSEIAAGLYRFAGSMARHDAEGKIRSISLAYSGLGLCKIRADDYSVAVTGWAMRADKYGAFDVLQEDPEDGCYLVGIDLPAGRYRIENPGNLATWTAYDRDFGIIDIRNHPENILVTVQPSVFALEIHGRIRPV